MSDAHEIAEKIEDAAHESGEGGEGREGKGGRSIGRYIGLTMAVIGVMLAVCSAFVGGERTELVKTMVDQSNTYADFQASSTKYRMMMAQVQQTYATAPSHHASADALDRLAKMPVPKEQQPLADVERSALEELLDILTPRKAEIASLLETLAHYDEERKASRAWAASYDEEVHAHFVASEHFERAQLVAEIAIVIASIALLLASRGFWYASLGGAVLCAVLMATTWTETSATVRAGEAKIDAAHERYDEAHGAKGPDGKRLADVRDEETLAKVRHHFGLDTPPAAPARP